MSKPELTVIMDSIGSISPYPASSLAMRNEVQGRGWEIRALRLIATLRSACARFASVSSTPACRITIFATSRSATWHWR